MKQVTLSIKEGKFQFFLELMKNLDFVQLDSGEDSVNAIRNNIKQGLEEVKLAKQGKLKTTSAQDFLDEL